MKKVLAALLAVALVIGLCSVFAFADGGKSSEDAYKEAQLRYIADFIKSEKFDTPSSLIGIAAGQALHEKFGYEIAKEFDAYIPGEGTHRVFNACVEYVTWEELTEALIEKYPLLTEDLIDLIAGVPVPGDSYTPWYEAQGWPHPDWCIELATGIVVNDGSWSGEMISEFVSSSEKDGVYSFYYQYQEMADETTVLETYDFVVNLKIENDKAVLVSYGSPASDSGAASSETQTSAPAVKYEVPAGLVIAGDSVFAAGTTVSAKTVESGAVYDAAKKAMSNVTQKFVVFDINALKDGAAVQPNGKVKVTFPIPATLSPDNLKLFYVSADGKKEEIKLTVDKNAKTATAELSHFSTYVLANVATSPDTGDATSYTLWYLLCFVSFAGIALSSVALKARKEN